MKGCFGCDIFVIWRELPGLNCKSGLGWKGSYNITITISHTQLRRFLLLLKKKKGKWERATFIFMIVDWGSNEMVKGVEEGQWNALKLVAPGIQRWEHPLKYMPLGRAFCHHVSSWFISLGELALSPQPPVYNKSLFLIRFWVFLLKKKREH